MVQLKNAADLSKDDNCDCHAAADCRVQGLIFWMRHRSQVVGL